MRVPNFFIIGAPKCGTTSMAAYLADHPDVFMATPKEPHYFNKDHQYRGVKSWSDYLSLFADAPANCTILGEASVWYLYSTVALREIQKKSPDARFLVMIRNPVEMFPSLHGQFLYHGRETIRNPEMAWRVQERRKQGSSLPRHCIEPAHLQYKSVCSLGTLLRQAYDMVPKEHLLTIFLDDLRKNPRKEFLSVLQFLGLSDDGRRDFFTFNKNKQPRSALLHSGLNTIRRTLSESGIRFNTGLYKKVKMANTKISQRRSLSKPFYDELVETFESEIALLEWIFDRDLSEWRRK